MSVSALSAKSFHQEMVKSKSVLAVFQALRAVNEKVDPYPIYLTFAGFVIQLLQYVGFAFGPIFVYTYLLADEVSYFVYLWSGPLFDRNYGSLSYSVYSALVCVFAALLAGSIGISVVAIIVPSFLEHKRFINILRAVLESIGGWLYIPLLHLFLGGMSCHNGSISSFPDETCGQTLRYVNIAVGILGILCTCVIAVAMCWVYDLSGDSQHLLGRAHGYFDLVFVLAKTVLCVFLHILIPQDEPTVFAFLVVAVSLLLFGLLVVVMPFYKNQTSAIFCAIFTITAFLALLNAFENINVKYFKTSSCSARCFLALSLAPFVGLLGYACATIRVNPDFQNRIGTLQMFGISSEHVARFPLPRTFTIRDLGLVSPGLRAVDKDLIQEMTIEETSPNSNSVTGDVPMTEEPLPEEDELAVMRKHRAEFFVPYLQMMHLPTDAEVATRFLRAFKIKTGGAVKFPAGQLNYALRMYFKAVVYFKQSGYVTVCLGWFLYEYCNRTAAVVELLNDMERRRHVSNDYVIMFKAFRLAVSAKEALGYRDATHLLSLQRARVHHRQVLATTVSFWDALLQERDRVTLIMINDELSYQRHAAMAEYRLALSTSQDDRSTLYSISEFVEDVFNEKEIAHELRVSIDEIELQKKSRMLRGAQPKSRQKISHLDFDDILSAIQIDTVATNSTHKFEKRVFLGLLYLAVVLSWLASASMLILAVIMMKHAERSRNAVHEIKNTAANGYLVIYLTEVLGIFSLTNSCTTNTSCGSDASYLDLLQNISAAEMAMRISHNLATYGKYGPSFGASPYKYVTEGLLPVGFYPSGADFTAGTFSCSGCSASRLYQKLLSTLNMDSDPMPEWIASSTVSAYVTTMVNRMQHSMTYDHYMQFITDGGAEVFLKGSDVYANVTVSNVTDIKNSIVVGLIVSVLVLVLAVGFGVTVFFVNLEWMAKGRVLVVGLFTVIPVLFLQQLRDQTQNRLDAFEVSGDSRETDMQLGLQESDDDDVMDHTVEEMSPDNLATHNSHIPTLLQMKPHRSCFKQLNSMVLDVSGRHKSVRFQLTQRDLADRPKQRLLEPKLAVDQEGKDIVADFEKSLAEIDSEMKEETQNERQRRDTNTEHRVNTSYRVQWSRIKSRLSAWNTSIPLFQLLFSGVLIPLLLITSIVAVVLSGMLHHSNAKVLPTEQSSLNELTTLYTYVSAFQRFDIDVSVFCNFFYVTASDSIAAYAFQSQRYKYLIRRLQEQSDVSILEIVPNAVTLSTMILRPVVTDIIYAVLAARAASALNEYNLSAQPYFATFSYGEGESNSVSLSNVYPSAFELPQQYEIPALENFSDDATTMLEQVQSMHRRARFYADETNIQNSLMGAATQALDTMMETLNGYKKTSIGYFIGVFVCVAAVIVGCGVGIILAYKFNHSRAVRIFLSVALAFALVTLIMAIVAYEYQFWKKLDASEAFSSVGTITEYQTKQFLRLTYIEQYINSPTYATLHAIYPSISGGSSSASSDLTGLAADYATIQDVAMFLAYAGRAKIANPAAPIDQLTPGAPFISSYNYASEPNYLQDSMTYANDHPTLMYSNPQADLTAHTGEELLQMARFAVFGLRGSTYYTNLMDSIESTFTTVASDYSSKMKSGDDKELGLLIATIILACLVVVCLLGATAHPLVLLVISMAEGKNSKLVRATMTVSYWELFRLVIIAASCCVAFGVVQFVLILVPLPTSREASDITLHSSARIEEIQHSMATALYGYHAVYAQSAALAITAFSQLSKSISVLQSCREFLYYSSTASSGGYAHIASLNDDQRNLLFTATTTGGMSMDKVYMNWIATLQRLANFQPEMYISTPVPTAPAKNLYSITDDQQQQISDALDTLQSMYYDLLNVLEESSSLYSNSISSAVHKSLAPAIIFFILSAGGGVIAMVYILPSLSRRMSKEEEEIGLLLKTIPKAVHDAVPSISLYVGSGQLDEDAEDAKSRFTLSPQAKEFLEQWQQTEPQDAGMEIFRVLEICPHGVVVTDDVGTILFANTALLEMMHHDTLKGKSISVMMEPTIAEVHGELMARYIRNPRPTGPQTLDVMAYTKDGEALHVVNVLGDAPSRSRQRYFISEIHRFSAHGSTRDRKRRSSNPVTDSKN